MKQFKYLIVICVLIASCSDSSEPKAPKNLISKDKMVDVLIDLSLVSSAKGINKKVLEKNGITPDEYVFKRFKIDSAQFSESNAYYSYYIDDYKQILNEVQDSLNRLKKKYNHLDENNIELKITEDDKKSKTKAKKLRDSLIGVPK